ncbi:recombinase family protein [Caballeronia sp. RCC_10]|uniref:recombinase family protein n=1 Tax=Caballeronia sp. RCC_10 TaxID=3239227 RepID=UPI0035247EAA
MAGDLDSSIGEASSPRRAAEYVRMSTEHQQYSTENQRSKIREYASRHHLTVVATYADEGKSGLRLDGRAALQRLIRDVEARSADFNVILVYDVSRWGRFQDADESAYYEYVCRRAGINVVYCAEQFENDGSPVSTIVKGVKRAMAGEYSRELSTKVFAGQCRLVEMGFRQGGLAGFGLTRVLLDQSGLVKSELARGERKSLQTDRVVLVPGPESETRIVRLMYQWFIEESLTEAHIAGRLNAMNVRTDLDRVWTKATVHEILANQKYIGNNIYNRVSFKLKKLRVANPPEMWIRKDGAFESVVPPDVFYMAQGILRARARRYSNEELLERLRQLYKSRGFLSGIVIDEAEGMPSSSVYSFRFGSLVRAYQAVGFTPDRDYQYVEINRLLRRLHPEIINETERLIAKLGGETVRDPATDVLSVNREFTVSIVLARCQYVGLAKRRWKVRFDASLLPDITVAVRMKDGNEAPYDYYLLPRLDFGKRDIHLAERNSVELETYRFDTLEYLYRMAQRARLRRVA